MPNLSFLAAQNLEILDWLREGVWISDASHRIVYVNPAMAEIAGVDARQLIGSNVLEYPEQTLKFFRGEFLSAQESLEPRDYLCEIVTPTGRHSWQGGWLTPIVEDGRYAGMLCTVRDLTDTHEAHRQLEQLSAEQQVILNSDLFGVVKLQNDRRIAWVNHAFADMFGYAREELVGQSMRVLHPDETAYLHLVEQAYSCMESGQTFRIETRQRHKDGSLGWYSIALRTLTSQYGYTLGLFIDVTDRKLNEASVRESKHQLELALSGSDLGLWDWDIASGHVSFDERWCGMLGYRCDEVAPEIGSWEKLIHPDDWPAIRTVLEAHLRGETPAYESEHRLLHRDGHWVWVLDRGKVVVRDGEGRPVRAAGTHLDISDRKRLKLEGTELLRRIEALILGLEQPPMQVPPAVSKRRDNLLTARQHEVLELIARGFTSAQVAEQLKISQMTAVTHRRNLMRKLDMHSTAELTRYAIRHKLIAD